MLVTLIEYILLLYVSYLDYGRVVSSFCIRENCEFSIIKL